MATTEVTKVWIGTRGPSGAGVSAAEKASFVTVAAANVFTNTLYIRKTSTTAFNVSNDAGATTVFRVDTSALEVHLANSSDLRGFSDVGTTEKWRIDGATGDIQTDGTITVDSGSYKGEKLWWEIEIDGGGIALTTGVKRRIKIPYSCVIESDGAAVWEVVVDPSGSVGLDLWMDSYANFPPTVADRISGTIGSQNPRVTSTNKATGNSTTGWTTTLTKGNYLFVAVDSATTSTWATLSLHVRKT